MTYLKIIANRLKCDRINDKRSVKTNRIFCKILYQKLNILETKGPYWKQAFLPTPTMRFFLQGWDSNVYNWIFLDEFNVDNYCFEKWKQMASGELVQIESKFSTPFTESLQMPMVFISNLLPPIEKEGFSSRVEIIEAHNGNGKIIFQNNY